MGWEDPDGLWRLVSAPEVPHDIWTPFAGAVASTPSGAWEIEIDPEDPARFFQLRFEEPSASTSD